MNDRHALICGISGQDGAYLADFLLRQGYRVTGTTRGDPAGATGRLARLGVEDRVQVVRMNPAARPEVDQALASAAPGEIYYLAAQSSVWRSFEDPAGTFEGSATGLLNMLEAARAAAPAARIFYAGSGDCFGETSADAPAREDSPFRPRSPYAAAKCAGHQLLSVLRLAYGQFACTGFLFTHESPLRPEDFAVGKAVAAVRRIAEGSAEKLTLGNADIVRDWGWAPDYVEAMWRMLQLDAPEDLVIASGRSHRLAELVERIFAARGLDWQAHVETGAPALRPTDIETQYADPSRARERLGWSSALDLDELARRLVA